MPPFKKFYCKNAIQSDYSENIFLVQAFLSAIVRSFSESECASERRSITSIGEILSDEESCEKFVLFLLSHLYEQTGKSLQKKLTKAEDCDG